MDPGGGLRRVRAPSRSGGPRSPWCTGRACTTGGRWRSRCSGPGSSTLVATDLDLMQPLFEVLARQTGDQMAGSILQLLDGLRQQLGEELDLRNEARALAHFRRLGTEFDLPLVVVPEPYPELSGPNVLTMEFLRRRAHRRPGAGGRARVRPGPAGRAGGAGLLRHHGALGGLPRRRARRQHAPASTTAASASSTGASSAGSTPRPTGSSCGCSTRCWATRRAWPDVTAHLTRTYGRAIQEGLGLDDEQLTAFMRSLIEPTLTRPFGEVSLAALLEAPQAPGGPGPGRRGPRAVALRAGLPRLRAQRRMRRLADEAGRPHVGVRPGHLPAGQAADVLRALRQDVPGRRAPHARPRVLRRPAGRRPRGRPAPGRRAPVAAGETDMCSTSGRLGRRTPGPGPSRPGLARRR